jgi:hypothetical protein
MVVVKCELGYQEWYSYLEDEARELVPSWQVAEIELQPLYSR